MSPKKSALPPFDTSLWFRHLGCTGKHYLLGNPHTVTGRLWAWCPKEECSFFLNRADIGVLSKAADYWIQGFLHGVEPNPPEGDDGTTDFQSKDYQRWQTACRNLQATGVWKAPSKKPVR